MKDLRLTITNSIASTLYIILLLELTPFMLIATPIIYIHSSIVNSKEDFASTRAEQLINCYVERYDTENFLWWDLSDNIYKERLINIVSICQEDIDYDVLELPVYVFKKFEGDIIELDNLNYRTHIMIKRIWKQINSKRFRLVPLVILPLALVLCFSSVFILLIMAALDKITYFSILSFSIIKFIFYIILIFELRVTDILNKIKFCVVYKLSLIDKEVVCHKIPKLSFTFKFICIIDALTMYLYSKSPYRYE